MQWPFRGHFLYFSINSSMICHMLRSILTTSWNHTVRTKYTSALVIAWFMILFLTTFVGFSMIKLLMAQKEMLVEKFTYPLFISNLYTFEHPRVRSFTTSLWSTGITGELQYVSRDQALDEEVKSNPEILSVLDGQNPLPDMIMIPLYKTDVTVLWKRIQEFRDIFDSVQSFELLRARLKKFESSMQSIDHIVFILSIFVILTALLTVMLVFMMIRYYARIFHLEHTIGKLVGAHPFYFWWPQCLCMICYALIWLWLAHLVFTTLKTFF